jgi:hypothetical protein
MECLVGPGIVWNPRLPVHLLNRPCLADFLQHLQRSQASLGALLAEQEVADKVCIALEKL